MQLLPFVATAVVDTVSFCAGRASNWSSIMICPRKPQSLLGSRNSGTRVLRQSRVCSLSAALVTSKRFWSRLARLDECLLECKTDRFRPRYLPLRAVKLEESRCGYYR
jgi:hypothetical protein